MALSCDLVSRVEASRQAVRRASVRGAGIAGLLGAMLLGAGCAYIPSEPLVDTTPLESTLQPRPQPMANGAIFQPLYGNQPLFEDRRPRAIGDIITILLDENVSASKSSASNASRDGSVGFSLSAIPDFMTGLLDGTDADIEGDNDFTGSGGSNANNSFTGTITVTVSQVQPNGNLEVRGDKRIAINQGTESIRFSGVVNPRTISSANTVQSTQVASARIEYVGDGYINEAQNMGWMQRFFLNLAPF